MSFPARLGILLALGCVQTALYLWLNHHPPRPSSLLPLTAIDRALPFWPGTIWAYFALLACEIVLPLLVRTRDMFLRLVVAYGIAMSVAFATYALYPTHFPRPEQSNPSWAWQLLLAQDTPECCLPSGHILVPLLAALALASEQKRIWPLAWVALLAPSVITTRQHYAWDVLAAVVLAALAWIASAARRPSARGRA